MAYTIKYLGSQIETTTDNQITVANCVTSDNDALVVFAGGYDVTGTPTVAYDGVNIINDDWRKMPVSLLSGGIWRKNAIWNGRTGDVVATFSTSITRRYCIVYAITNAGRTDQVKRNGQDTDTTAPNTLLTDFDLAVNNELMLAYHLSNGPITDTAGTPEAGLTVLHRIGTSIGTNDITIQTTQKEVVPVDKIRSYMTGATSRKWLSALIALRPLIVNPPALDFNGVEIVVGDTVTYPGGSSTVSSIFSNPGSIQVKVTLANGDTYKSYDLEVTS